MTEKEKFKELIIVNKQVEYRLAEVCIKSQIHILVNFKYNILLTHDMRESIFEAWYRLKWTRSSIHFLFLCGITQDYYLWKETLWHKLVLVKNRWNIFIIKRTEGWIRNLNSRVFPKIKTLTEKPDMDLHLDQTQRQASTEFDNHTTVIM